MDFKIDAVITWVDGDDPRHRSKREAYGTKKMLGREDVAGSTRYSSLGEIFYCVASLNRYAPWLNKIYIVTDEQDPQLEEFMCKHFPNGHIPMEIVDHKVIFRGYEDYLPTFNSIAIESMTWRIPALSEHFIEFNDDLILAAPTRPEDFFTEEGRVVCYGRRQVSLFSRISRLLKYRMDGTKAVSFTEAMLNAAALAGSKFCHIKICHTPKALLRSVYESYFAEHEEHLLLNIRHRFRHASQYNAEELQYTMLYNEGRCEIRSDKDNHFYLMAKPDTAYIERKLKAFSRDSHKKFGCFNSLDKASEEGLRMAIAWIEKRIGL